jgi:hypothetical protein
MKRFVRAWHRLYPKRKMRIQSVSSYHTEKNGETG